MNKRKQQKKTFRFSEYHLLLVSAVMFILQYSYFDVNTINFPKWIYFVLVIIAVVINVLIKHAGISVFFKLSEFIRVFKSFIAYFFLSFGFGLLLFGLLNKMYSNRNDLEYLELKIVRVTENTSKSPNRIYFKLNTREYGVSVPGSPEVSRLIKNKDVLKRSYLQLDCRKGLFGTYLIDDKNIIFK